MGLFPAVQRPLQPRRSIPLRRMVLALGLTCAASLAAVQFARRAAEPGVVGVAENPSREVRDESARREVREPVAQAAALRWMEAARAGRYAEALAGAEAADFDAICDTGPEDELRLLADSARLAGNAERAQQAWGAIRSRFAGSAHAAVAAFWLGELSFAQAEHFDDAVGWYSAYLIEEPDGPFAREARSGLMEALLSLGNPTAARRAAEQYIARYPDGPQADRARSLLKP